MPRAPSTKPACFRTWGTLACFYLLPSTAGNGLHHTFITFTAMTRSRSSYFATALLLVVLLVATAAWKWRLPERSWFAIKAWSMASEPPQHGLRLSDYEVVVEALPLPDIENVSALTYNEERKTLFTVTNQDPELIELSLEGAILRRIPLYGFEDPEAIEHIEHSRYIISEERQQRLYKVRLDETTEWLNATDYKHLTLGIGRSGNLGFEGLAWDKKGTRLFVAKEKPVRIYEIQGFPAAHADAGNNMTQTLAIAITDDPQRDRRLFVRDLSSLHYDMRSGHLLVLSDESKLILELDIMGHPISKLSLARGQNGLKQSVPQAEGLAMDENGTIYLVSEPNLFYVFKKRP